MGGEDWGPGESNLQWRMSRVSERQLGRLPLAETQNLTVENEMCFGKQEEMV